MWNFARDSKMSAWHKNEARATNHLTLEEKDVVKDCQSDVKFSGNPSIDPIIANLISPVTAMPKEMHSGHWT